MGEYTHHIVAFALHLHWAADTPEPAQLHSRSLIWIAQTGRNFLSWMNVCI
jgi:hypothetical protein